MEGINSATDPKNKAPYDPGWNDPPKFTYNAQQTTPNRPRNFLNKRVAFPLSNSPGQGTSPLPNLPPMPGAPPAPSMPPLIPQPIFNPAEDEDKIDSENTLKQVKDILIHFLESSSELGPKANDVKRRISVMEDMWLSGKLNKRIHLLMKELAIALRDDVPSKADEIHKALMVDHVSCVGTWMPGIKQLIHHCIAKSELLSIEKDVSNEEDHTSAL